jgi:pimeloyl-ACP methyl ester carboxylesterase
MFPAGRAGFAVRWLTLPSGLRVRAVVCEPPPSAEPPPVALFVHGWACSAYTWHRNLRVVAEAGIRAIAVDLKGHGLSDKPLDFPGYTLPAMGAHLLDILDALALDEAVLVGHSMGGAIALRLAIDAPDRVLGLVLPAPVGFGAIGWMRVVPWVTPAPVDPLLPHVAVRCTVRLGLWRAYGRIGRPTERDVDEYWAPSRGPAVGRAMRRLAHAVAWTSGRPEELARVRCPVSVIFGERDHLVRPAASEPIVRHLPDVRVETVARAGHTLPEEVPDVVNAAIIDAVRRSASLPSRPTMT